MACFGGSKGLMAKHNIDGALLTTIDSVPYTISKNGSASYFKKRLVLWEHSKATGIRIMILYKRVENRKGLGKK